MTCPKCQRPLEARELSGGPVLLCPTLHYSYVPPRNITLSEENASFLTGRTAELQNYTYTGTTS